MDASRGHNGIQLLLTAEQEAQQIVNAARNAKLARLKQAKEEAEKEVAEFRAQMEADYQRKLTEVSIYYNKRNQVLDTCHSLKAFSNLYLSYIN
ncbi:putative vacuolar (H+)-ATPase G subunit [Helianthus annuus]|nr:putative vacuolar (H+)-ATPase G subunit [Helianthus annuus]